MVELLESTTLTFIKEVGFPITLSLIVVGFLITLLIKITKRDFERTSKSDQRYEDLVNRFINKIGEISERHDTTIREVTSRHEKTMEQLYLAIKNTNSKIESFEKTHEGHIKWVVDEIKDIQSSIKDKVIYQKELVDYPPYLKEAPGYIFDKKTKSKSGKHDQ